MISLHNVNKIFESNGNKFQALSNVQLEIERGELLAVIGKSGSGKSTLLNIITGIDHQTNGEVVVNNVVLSQLNESELAKWRGKNIGIVFQFFQLIPTLTILENLLLAMEFVNVFPEKERRSRALNLLHQVGIEEQAGKMPSALSGGQQQRAAIARALANDPEIIIADEPTGNLDSSTAGSIYGLFKELSALGKTIVVVTHDSRVASMYNRVIEISDGKIVKS